MTFQGQIVTILVALVVVAVILRLLRDQNLEIAYGLLWIGLLGFVVLLMVFTPLLNLVTRLVGAIYPVSALSLLAFAVLTLILIYLSSKVSVLARRQKDLDQQIALLEFELRERETAPPADRGG